MDAASALVADVMNGDAALGLSSIRTYDSYTFDHSIDMAVAAVMIGKNIGLGEGDLRLLATGCMLHDTGKVFIDREILNKPGKLTPEEQDVMRQHAALGYEAVKQLFGPGVLSNHIPYQHHERQDGGGYPRGLVGTNTLPRPGERRDGKNILLLAEIASIADIYDALNSDRPYRPALPTDQILKLINSLSGTALNEALVDAFLKTMAPFPQGVEVELRGGPLDGFKAVVARVHRDNLPRPLVRVLYDPRNRRVEPSDLDLRAYPDVQLVPTIILPADEFGDQTSPLPYMEATLAAGRADLLRPDVC
jgi:HD-GYP domain-containing protein (c-di-GMP phosphodiesterase class II)